MLRSGDINKAVDAVGVDAQCVTVLNGGLFRVAHRYTACVSVEGRQQNTKHDCVASHLHLSYLGFVSILVV